jgi:O-antigen/teichoic acid export membrane protein
MNRVRVGLVSEIFHRKDQEDVSRQSLEHVRTRSLGASLIVTNIFGPSGMGVFAYGFAIAAFFCAAAALGIDKHGRREYVRHDLREHRGPFAQASVLVIVMASRSTLRFSSSPTPHLFGSTAAIATLPSLILNALYLPSLSALLRSVATGSSNIGAAQRAKVAA